MGRCKLAYLLIIASIKLSEAYAIPMPKCPTSKLGTEIQAGFLHKIAILGADGRVPLSKFAKEEASRDLPEGQILKSLSGVGVLTCLDGTSVAQLTASNDVITTAKHPFFLKHCQPIPVLGRPCYFQPVGSKAKYDVHIDWNNLTESPDPRNARIKCDGIRANDWAVLKLKRPVKGASFFQLPNSETVVKATDVVQISLRATESDVQFAAQKCRVRQPFQQYGGIVAKHDCDTEGGSSGGAQLVFSESDKTFYLWGLHSAGKSRPIDPNLQRTSTASPQEPKAEYEEYDGEENRNISVPVTRELIEEVNRLKGLKPGS